MPNSRARKPTSTAPRTARVGREQPMLPSQPSQRRAHKWRREIEQSEGRALHPPARDGGKAPPAGDRFERGEAREQAQGNIMIKADHFKTLDTDVWIGS